jgi:hypothetical protein
MIRADSSAIFLENALIARLSTLMARGVAVDDVVLRTARFVGE